MDCDNSSAPFAICSPTSRLRTRFEEKLTPKNADSCTFIVCCKHLSCEQLQQACLHGAFLPTEKPKFHYYNVACCLTILLWISRSDHLTSEDYFGVQCDEKIDYHNQLASIFEHVRVLFSLKQQHSHSLDYWRQGHRTGFISLCLGRAKGLTTKHGRLLAAGEILK